jgi:hypothetical protein
MNHHHDDGSGYSIPKFSGQEGWLALAVGLRSLLEIEMNFWQERGKPPFLT